jgi:L-histidine N-alpha-methyltransferase
MLLDVLEGLSQPVKELSPKYFYDVRGSELFEEITTLEEYYPTRTERALLERWMPGWVGEARPASLVELGAGSASKSRIVLDAMEAHGTGRLYVPVDVSGDFLHETAARLREEYETLRVEPRVADITAPMDLPGDLPAPTWYALLGSTLGNFDRTHATRLLARVAGRMRPGDGFLLGVDRQPGPHKTVARLESAYDDGSGVTAAFNLNVLLVLNRALGSDFDVGSFRHRAFWNEDEGRIEMHLVSMREHVVHFPEERDVRLAEGESIRTEVSYKYDRARVDGLFEDAGLRVDRWVEDADALFALVLGEVRR